MRCQNCAMPLSEEFGNFGTNADGPTVSEYCVFCLSGGGFTNPNQTLEVNDPKLARKYDF